MRMFTGLILMLGFVVSGFGEMRTWTSKTGQTIEAEYVRNATGKVMLKTPGGKEKKVPISALSQVDQDYIYLKNSPTLEVTVDDNKKRKSVKDDIDNKKEDLQFEVEIRKTSKNPYPGKITAHLFVLGWNLREEEYVLLDKKKEVFTLTPESDNKYSFTGERLRLEYDPHPGWGVKYDGYLICIKRSDGQVLLFKGKKRFEKKIRGLMEASTGDRFDEDMRELGVENRRIRY